MQQQLIKHLCDSFSDKQSRFTDLDQSLFHYLTKQQASPLPYSVLDQCNEKNPIKRLESWRNLFKAALLTSFKSAQDDHPKSLKETWYKLASFNLFKEFQIEQAYTKLVAYLLNIPYNLEVDPVQHEGGLTPIESAAHWPLMTTPTLEWHAELGTLWVLLGQLTHQPKWIRAAEKLALWQMQSLDYDGLPHKGFLSSHPLNSHTNTLLRQAVLFQAVALSTSNPQFAFLAKKHFSKLIELDREVLEGISLDAALVCNWLGLIYKDQLTPISPDLQSTIQHDTHAYVGFRSPSLSVLVSLLGRNMGMGSLKSSDVEIPAFGPQVELLGEEQLFGIFGQNPMDPEKVGQFKVDQAEQEFNVKGVIGLPSVQRNQDYFQRWHCPSDWMETNIFFENNTLNIEVTPYKVKSKLYFVFYASSKKCLINGEEKIQPRSLNQFQGQAAPISLIGDKSLFILDSLNSDQEMKIIPLEGQRSFWGSNYLIAYHLNNKYSTFKWKITTKDL